MMNDIIYELSTFEVIHDHVDIFTLPISEHNIKVVMYSILLTYRNSKHQISQMKSYTNEDNYTSKCHNCADLYNVITVRTYIMS